MRHFSSHVPACNVIAISVDESFVSSAFVEVQRALMIAMDANPSNMNPSEEAVLADFIRWFKDAKEADRNGMPPVKPVFMYVNMNEGFTSLVLLTDPKGKLTLV
jgi:hypothetical protein